MSAEIDPPPYLAKPGRAIGTDQKNLHEGGDSSCIHSKQDHRPCSLIAIHFNLT